VLDDGGETDLDLGNYKRFLSVSLTSKQHHDQEGLQEGYWEEMTGGLPGQDGAGRATNYKRDTGLDREDCACTSRRCQQASLGGKGGGSHVAAR
jgi:hypothetical protein